MNKLLLYHITFALLLFVPGPASSVVLELLRSAVFSGLFTIYIPRAHNSDYVFTASNVTYVAHRLMYSTHISVCEAL